MNRLNNFLIWFWFPYDYYTKRIGCIKKIVKIRGPRTFLVDCFGGNRMSIQVCLWHWPTLRFLLWRRLWKKYYL